GGDPHSRHRESGGIALLGTFSLLRVSTGRTMTALLNELFSQPNFIPHGFCLLWEPRLLWLHVISDSIVALSYYTIPFAILYFISRRRDLAFRGIFALTGTFILACGTTHVMDVLT